MAFRGVSQCEKAENPEGGVGRDSEVRAISCVTLLNPSSAIVRNGLYFRRVSRPAGGGE